MRNRSDQILDMWDAEQEAQRNLATASTLDLHAGQMFPNRKAAQDLAQRMAGVNTAGNFLRDLGAARLGTTQAARMGRVDPAEMLREKLVGSMTDRLGQVGKEGGPGSMSDVFSEFNPAMSLMGGQPYEPRQDPMAAFKDPKLLARLMHFVNAQNGIQSDPTQLMQQMDALFQQGGGPKPQQGAPSVSNAAAAIRSSSANPLLQVLGITPDTSPENVNAELMKRQSSDSPLSDDELRQIADFATNMKAVKPGYGKSRGWGAMDILQSLLNLKGGSPSEAARKAMADKEARDREAYDSAPYDMQHLMGVFN